MLDFTISKSTCHLYFQNEIGNVFYKSYHKHSNLDFFVNGDVYESKGKLTNKIINNIFKAVKLVTFETNLHILNIPDSMK